MATAATEAASRSLLNCDLSGQTLGAWLRITAGFASFRLSQAVSTDQGSRSDPWHSGAWGISTYMLIPRWMFKGAFSCSRGFGSWSRG
jgi:hypothetical protein